MACRTIRQRPLNSFQMVLQQNATIVGDADQDSRDSECDNQRTDKLKLRLTYEQTIKSI